MAVSEDHTLAHVSLELHDWACLEFVRDVLVQHRYCPWVCREKQCIKA